MLLLPSAMTEDGAHREQIQVLPGRGSSRGEGRTRLRQSFPGPGGSVRCHPPYCWREDVDGRSCGEEDVDAASSSFPLNHIDAGSYSTVGLPPFLRYRRNEELLLPWMEVNAFTVRPSRCGCLSSLPVHGSHA